MQNRLTTLNKNGLPALKNPLHMERAVAKLYQFEQLDVSLDEIKAMKITISNLRNRIKAMEDW